MEHLQPGDIILDSAGYPVIEHQGRGASALIAANYEIFRGVLTGEITRDEYASHLITRTQIQASYNSTAQTVELPEGAVIIPGSF